ncbi:MAG: leucine-rich repeat domain-containing protein [Clostridia bacterium]|nr:leucine-rich repeat domain-containing protein [Clostridia bacterium]
MKRIIAIFVLLFASLLLVTGCGQEELEPTPGLEFYLLSDGTYAVYIGTADTSKVIVIPSEYCGEKVTAIADRGFIYTDITSVVIPDSVTTIGDSAFEGCTSLTNITIPDSVTEIDQFAFNKCTSLTSITIPDSVTTIGWYAFYNCTSLTNITILGSVTEIGKCVFNNCTSLKNIKYAGTVEQWEAVYKNEAGNKYAPDTVVVCTDGEVSIK